MLDPSHPRPARPIPTHPGVNCQTSAAGTPHFFPLTPPIGPIYDIVTA